MLTCLKSFECNQGALRAVRFTADGLYCLTCGSDCNIKLWNPKYGRNFNTYQGHVGEVLDVVSTSNSSFLVSGSTDHSVIYWDFLTATSLRHLNGHVAPVASVSFDEKLQLIISGGLDSKVCGWDVRCESYEPQFTFKEAQAGVTSIRFIDHEILAGSIDGHVRRYDMRNHRLITYYLGEPVTYVNFTKDGQCFLVSVAGNSVKLVEKESSKVLGVYTGHGCLHIRVESCLNSNDTVVIAGSMTGHIYFWDRSTCLVSYKLIHAPGSAIQTISFNNAEKLLSASTTVVKYWGK